MGGGVGIQFEFPNTRAVGGCPQAMHVTVKGHLSFLGWDQAMQTVCLGVIVEAHESH
jgi:hypothetical protein